MRSKRKVLVGLMSFLLGILVPSSPRALEAEDADAFEVSFDRSPLWVVSGAWNQAGDRLLLVDSMRREIIPVATDGTTLAAISPSLAGSGFTRFNIIQNSNGRLHVDLDSVGIAPLDDNLNIMPREIKRLASAGFPSSGTGRRIAAIHAWTVLGKQVIAFADIEQQVVPQWVSGFVRIPLDQPEKFQDLISLNLSLGDPMLSYYQLGLNLMASNGTSAFILVMDDPPYLVTSDTRGATRTVIVERACGTRPTVPTIGRRAELAVALAALERGEGPIGVYTQNNRVFLLCRRWVGQEMQFSVAEIDMATGAAVFLNPIDTSASHLVVVPGPDYWAFVEKGPVLTTEKGHPFMEIKSTLMVPAEAVVDPKRRTGANGTRPNRATALSPLVRYWLELAFSGFGLVLLSLLFRRIRAFCSRVAREVAESIRGGLKRARLRWVQRDAPEPSDSE